MGLFSKLFKWNQQRAREGKRQQARDQKRRPPPGPPRLGILEPEPQLGPGRIQAPPIGHTGRSIIDPREVGDEMALTDLDRFLAGEQVIFADSSNVEWFKYDPSMRELHVGFKGKNRSPSSAYIYSQISPQEAASMFTAGSKGVWTWDTLRIRGTLFGHRKPYRRIR